VTRWQVEGAAQIRDLLWWMAVGVGSWGVVLAYLEFLRRHPPESKGEP
jgi:hypothetical protein